MPTIYPNKTLTATSADILNAIRNSATNDYKNYVPVVTADAEIIRSVGSILMQNPSLMNEFLSALCNRIGKVLINSRLYNNPWAVFKFQSTHPLRGATAKTYKENCTFFELADKLSARIAAKKPSAKADRCA